MKNEEWKMEKILAAITFIAHQIRKIKHEIKQIQQTAR